MKTVDGRTQASCITKFSKWTLNDQHLSVETCHPDVNGNVDEDFTILTTTRRSTLGFRIRKKEDVKFLPYQLFSDFPNLTFMEVRYTSVTTLNGNHFRSLSKLKKLDLKENKIVNVFSKAFFDLVSLESLDLSHNQIEILKMNTFASLKALKTLHLNNNKIGSLNSNIFKALINVELVNLNENRLVTLEANIFQNLERLKELHLMYNELDVIPKELFENNLNLTKILLGFNKIKTIDAHMFNHLQDLKFVGIESNVCTQTDYFVDNLDSLKDYLIQNCDEKTMQTTLVNTREGLEGITAFLTATSTALRNLEYKLEKAEKDIVDLHEKLNSKTQEMEALNQKIEKLQSENICDQSKTTTTL